MQENLVMITKVANGYLVVMPRQHKDMNNPNEFAKVMKNLQQGKDPLLEQIENAAKPEVETDEFTFVFLTKEEVLSFINEKL